LCPLILSASRYCLLFYLFFYCYGAHRYLHSFPTRRSSDLLKQCEGFCRFRTRSTRRRRDSSRGRWPCWNATVSTASTATDPATRDRKSTRLNSSHVEISYAVFCLKKKKQKQRKQTARLIDS